MLEHGGLATLRNSVLVASSLACAAESNGIQLANLHRVLLKVVRQLGMPFWGKGWSNRMGRMGRMRSDSGVWSGLHCDGRPPKIYWGRLPSTNRRSSSSPGR